MFFIIPVELIKSTLAKKFCMSSKFLEDLGNDEATTLYSEYDLRWSTLENSWNITVSLPTVSTIFLSRMILEIDLKWRYLATIIW